MAADDNATEETEAATDDGRQTPEEIRAELDRTRRALKAANREGAKHRTEADQLREAERKRQEAGLGEPEKLQRTLNQEREARTEAERKLNAEVEGRKRDRQERQVLALASKHLHEDAVDLAFGLIDRSFLEFDDDTGQITKGLDKALEDLAKRRPLLAKAKPKDPGSGPRKVAGGNHNDNQDPVAAAFGGRTSLGT